jgi:hypothetical protein
VTVDELKEVLDERFGRHEKHADEQHDAIISHFDRINGRVSAAEKDIRSLMIRDAFWAGGVVAVSAILRLLWK